VLGGNSHLNGVTYIEGDATFAGGTVDGAGPVTIAGSALFSGTNATFAQWQSGDAELQASNVLFAGRFLCTQEPAFTGGTVRFAGSYEAPTAHLGILAGAVRFDRDLTFGTVELLGGSLAGDSAPSVRSTSLTATTAMAWQGGTFRDLAVHVNPGATFVASGSGKVLTFTHALPAAMTFGTIAWSGGDLRLENGASMSGGRIDKTGPGNMTRSGTPATPVRAGEFVHAWGGTTTIDTAWTPSATDLVHVVQGTPAGTPPDRRSWSGIGPSRTARRSIRRWARYAQAAPS
jgi:hypothetical protein